jgi:hypothetical protein
VLCLSQISQVSLSLGISKILILQALLKVLSITFGSPQEVVHMGSGKCPLRIICSASLVMLLRATQTTKPKICLGPKVYKDFHEIEKGSSNSTCHLFVHRESLLMSGSRLSMR